MILNAFEAVNLQDYLFSNTLYNQPVFGFSNQFSNTSPVRGGDSYGVDEDEEDEELDDELRDENDLHEIRVNDDLREPDPEDDDHLPDDDLQ